MTKLDLAEVQERYPSTTCYRDADPRHHFWIHSYERPGDNRACLTPGCTHEHHTTDRVTVTIIHGSDSSSPGVATFGVDPTTLHRCDCGRWRWPTDEQIDETKRVVAGVSANQVEKELLKARRDALRKKRRN